MFGQLRVHNNSRVGILTNDPGWDWHVQNLNNFVGLQPNWPAQNELLQLPVQDAVIRVAAGWLAKGVLNRLIAGSGHGLILLLLDT